MGFTPNAYWLIPILAGLLQWLSTVLMQNQNKAMTDGNEQSAQMMKSMNIMMPLMSVWFCFSFASGIGLYWCASSAFMILQQLILNKYFAGQTDEEILQKSMEKVNAKRAKKGLPPIDEKSVETKIKKAQESLNKVEEKRMDIIAKQNIKTKESTDYYQKNAKPGSLASKANMVQMFNDKQDKEKNNH
jgi:YidC/Oxa1 family membrane protein insertase